MEEFATAIAVGNHVMPNRWVGAAFNIIGKLRDVPESVRDQGIMGFSPNAALQWLETLELDPGSQFLFDAPSKQLSFGDFTDGTFVWLDDAVADAADLWVIPAASTNLNTAVLIDTGNSIVHLAEDLVAAYFQQYPADAYEQTADGTYYLDCDVDTWYPLDLQLDNGNPEDRKDFGLTGPQLLGPYDSTDESTGKRWCVSYVGAL